MDEKQLQSIHPCSPIWGKPPLVVLISVASSTEDEYALHDEDDRYATTKN